MSTMSFPSRDHESLFLLSLCCCNFKLCVTFSIGLHVPLSLLMSEVEEMMYGMLMRLRACEFEGKQQSWVRLSSVTQCLL